MLVPVGKRAWSTDRQRVCHTTDTGWVVNDEGCNVKVTPHTQTHTHTHVDWWSFQ